MPVADDNDTLTTRGLNANVLNQHKQTSASEVEE